MGLGSSEAQMATDSDFKGNRSAVRYLSATGTDVAATGGTNWQKFLPPRFQKIISFPSLWTAEEKENWGKSWVDEHVFGINLSN